MAAYSRAIPAKQCYLPPTSPRSVPGVGSAAECQIVPLTLIWQIVYRGVFGLVDSRGLPSLRQICNLVRSGMGNSRLPLDHNKEWSSASGARGSLHHCTFASAASRVGSERPVLQSEAPWTDSQRLLHKWRSPLAGGRISPVSVQGSPSITQPCK